MTRDFHEIDGLAITVARPSGIPPDSSTREDKLPEIFRCSRLGLFGVHTTLGNHSSVLYFHYYVVFNSMPKGVYYLS